MPGVKYVAVAPTYDFSDLTGLEIAFWTLLLHKRILYASHPTYPLKGHQTNEIKVDVVFSTAVLETV